LIVVAIIAVLVGMLLPALGKARQTAKKINCLTNLRQLAMGMGMYLNDWSGNLNLRYNTGSVNICNSAAKDTWQNLLFPKYIGSKGVFACPSYLAAWKLPSDKYRTYAMSPFICEGSKFRNIGSYLKLSQIVLFSESYWASDFVQEPSGVYFEPRGYMSPWNWYAIAGLSLHGESGNWMDPQTFWTTAFLDGHADIVRAREYSWVQVCPNTNPSVSAKYTGGLKAIIYAPGYE
jgi:hypothetical protein